MKSIANLRTGSRLSSRSTADRAPVAGLRGLNAMLEGTALPRLDPTAVERLIHRDSLALLGLA